MIKVNKQTYQTSVRGARRYICDRKFMYRKIKHVPRDYGIVQIHHKKVDYHVRVYELVSYKKNKSTINQYDIIANNDFYKLDDIVYGMNRMIHEGKHFNEIFDYLKFKLI